MTQEELIKEIKQLPLDRQREILDVITRSVGEQAKPPEDRSSIVIRLRGIAKPDGPIPPDEELKEDYVRYLEEKYS